MSLFPPSTNHLSTGSLASVWCLGLYGLLEFGVGCVLGDGDEKPLWSGLVLGVALCGALCALLVAVVGAGDSPAVVIIVVQGEQVFHVPASWINAMGVT
jgi:hypothetical protein